MSAFDFQHYKQFIKASLSRPEEGRGGRARLAKALNCQTSFVSKVLNGAGHFSQEQVLRVARFLEVPATETEYLVMLYLRERAGTTELKALYEHRLDELRPRKWSVADRAVVGDVIDDDVARIYYSHWRYAAVYVAVYVDGFESMAALAERLQMSLPLVKETVDFLINCELLHRSEGKLVIGSRRIHLPRQSEYTLQNHVNWRLKAIQHMQTRGRTSDLHYSAILGLSREAVEPFKESLIKVVKESEKLLEMDGAHDLCLFNFDCIVL